jgi:hypothetical protein
LYALEAVRLCWAGVPVRPIQGFRLEEKNGLAVIDFNLDKIDPQGVCIYRSNRVPGSTEPRVFILRPLPGEAVQAASPKDSRPLAFHEVLTTGEKYGSREESVK